MRIAICDDNNTEREFLEYLLGKYFSKVLVQYECVSYNSGMSLYYDIEEGDEFDAVFLEILLKGFSGLDLARKLRGIGYKGKIIFGTISSDYAIQGYDVLASGYILKPYNIDNITETMERVFRNYRPKFYRIRQKAQVICIPFNEILYIESNNSKCIIHRTENRSYVVYKQLNKIEKELDDERFLRCHQSFLVNMNYIEGADDKFILTSGDIVMIRKRDKKDIHQLYMNYADKYLKEN